MDTPPLAPFVWASLWGVPTVWLHHRCPAPVLLLPRLAALKLLCNDLYITPGEAPEMNLQSQGSVEHLCRAIGDRRVCLGMLVGVCLCVYRSTGEWRAPGPVRPSVRAEPHLSNKRKVFLTEGPYCHPTLWFAPINKRPGRPHQPSHRESF